MDGNIVVDGVLVSCYPYIHHDLGHIGMAPLRWFPGFIQSIFGDDNGWQVYVLITQDLGKWIMINEF